ncbi:DUF1800 domain-containing protein [Chitinimonas sp. BJB300]|uniref:DUF1800 domain-containing protein n=1 Tax=Chitinimonas sp. BJB300 TaxID=1559339 RepID=UPI000C1189DF|nr:DUF1800 domain-containing protein [Chitinimonas sp. BJB300]PHV13259.1 hypothetical protein CSQ89_01725 [Chitinimonas sp. BJB300]TSJ89652.1 DUF1800 domain-containing protein [Chitinimonas sp. BJB300]
MIRLLPLFLVGSLLAATAAPIGEIDARHLLSRTGFAATMDEVTQYARLDRQAAVARLLSEVRTKAITPPPAWVDEPLPERRAQMSGDEEKAAFRARLRERGIALRAWWYDELLATPSPLTEHMTLFWHNHFVSAIQKVRMPQLMYRQNVLLRQEALGNFGRLLHAVAKDPAMLVYLDGVQNRRGEPNENFAREVMELFTLGEGHYSEQDIREAARALTGMSLERPSGEYRFRPALHDFGEKTIFGQRGNYDPDAFLDLLLNKPETAEFVITKLWKEFISPQPDVVEVKRWAKLFRDQRYEIKPLLQAMLSSDAFYAAQYRGVLVKSPVELTVGTFRQFGITPPDMRPLLAVNRNLGQDLFNPPNVKGWPGYTDWINSQTLLTRKQMLARVFRVADIDMPAMAQASKVEKASLRVGNKVGYGLYLDRWLGDTGGISRASSLLLPLVPERLPEGTPLEMIGQLVMNPLYQLK